MAISTVDVKTTSNILHSPDHGRNEPRWNRGASTRRILDKKTGIQLSLPSVCPKWPWGTMGQAGNLQFSQHLLEWTEIVDCPMDSYEPLRKVAHLEHPSLPPSTERDHRIPQGYPESWHSKRTLSKPFFFTDPLPHHARSNPQNATPHKWQDSGMMETCISLDCGFCCY